MYIPILPDQGLAVHIQTMGAMLTAFCEAHELPPLGLMTVCE